MCLFRNHLSIFTKKKKKWAYIDFDLYSVEYIVQFDKNWYLNNIYLPSLRIWHIFLHSNSSITYLLLSLNVFVWLQHQNNIGLCNAFVSFLLISVVFISFLFDMSNKLDQWNQMSINTLCVKTFIYNSISLADIVLFLFLLELVLVILSFKKFFH